MAILELKSGEMQDEETIAGALERVSKESSRLTLVTVEAIGATERHLGKAGDQAAGQDLVLASTLAEGIRTFHTQVAEQLTSDAVRSQTQHLISGLFEELSQLLQGIHLIGELSPQGRAVLLSYGERTSAVIVAQALKARDVRAESVAARLLYLSQSPSIPEKVKKRTVADVRREVGALLDSGTLVVIPASLKSHLP